MKIQAVELSEVRPYDRNPRKNERGVAKVAASIREFGFRQPIVVDPEMVIIAGHTRYLAAAHLGLDKVPVHVARGLSAEQLKAYRIADNRTAEESEWDEERLREEIVSLELSGVDLDLTGLDDRELTRLLRRSDAPSDEDDAPDLPQDPITQRGDIWICGSHRVMCGDCTDGVAVAMLMGEVVPLLMVTDPPYGVEYSPGWRKRAGVSVKNRAGITNDDRDDWREAWQLFPGDAAYVWHAALHAGVVAGSLESVGFEMRAQVIWAKTRFAISRGHYHWQHEPCWYSVRKGAKGHWSGDRSQSTLWTIAGDALEFGHSTQKPVECMRRPMENNSLRGGAVYDPFLGSGTTVIAAETTARSCFGMEIDPAYVDVAVKRWELFTGGKATRVSG